MEAKKEKTYLSPLQGCLVITLATMLSITILATTYFLVIGFNSDEKTTVSKQDNSIITNEEKSEEVHSKEDSEQSIKNVFVENLGQDTNYGEERLLDLQVNDHLGTPVQNDKIVIATLLGNENLTTSYTRKGMLNDTVKVMNNLFALDDIEEVTLIWQYPLVDVGGNTNNVTVLKISIDKEISSKINWDTFDSENFSRLANQYWEHSALQN